MPRRRRTKFDEPKRPKDLKHVLARIRVLRQWIAAEREAGALLDEIEARTARRRRASVRLRWVEDEAARRRRAGNPMSALAFETLAKGDE